MRAARLLGLGRGRGPRAALRGGRRRRRGRGGRARRSRSSGTRARGRPGRAQTRRALGQHHLHLAHVHIVALLRRDGVLDVRHVARVRAVLGILVAPRKGRELGRLEGCVALELRLGEADGADRDALARVHGRVTPHLDLGEVKLALLVDDVNEDRRQVEGAPVLRDRQLRGRDRDDADERVHVVVRGLAHDDVARELRDLDVLTRGGHPAAVQTDGNDLAVARGPDGRGVARAHFVHVPGHHGRDRLREEEVRLGLVSRERVVHDVARRLRVVVGVPVVHLALAQVHRDVVVLHDGGRAQRHARTGGAESQSQSQTSAPSAAAWTARGPWSCPWWWCE